MVTVLALAVRFSVLKDSHFVTDDFMLSARAVESPFGWDYLTRVHTGHFEPIGFAVVWALAHFAPLSWGWTCVVLLAGQAVLSVLVWRLLVELFGRRPLVIVPYAVFAFTPLTLPAFTWLSAAIIWIPLMAAVAGGLRAHTRYVRAGRPADALVATAWFVVGLAGFEKIVVYLPFIVAFTVALAPRTPITLPGLLRLARRTWVVWVGYAAASALYLVLYLPGVRGAGNDSPLVAPRTGTVSDFAFLSVFRTLVPAAFGGPWEWQPSSYALAIVDSPRAFDWACWILGLAVLVGSLVLRRGVGRFWFAFAVYLAGSVATIAVGRVAFGGAIVALETRYLADAAVPLAVMLGVCLLPLRGERDPWTPQATRLRASVPPMARVVAVGSVLALMMGLAFHSMGAYARFSTDNPSRAFLANTRASLADLPRGAQVFDTEMPAPMIGPIFMEYNLVSRYLAPLMTPAQRQDTYTRTSYSQRPYLLDTKGTLVPLVLGQAARSEAPTGSCLPVRDGRVTVPLTTPLFEWNWVVRVGYITDAEMTVTMRLGDVEREVELGEGLGEVYAGIVAAGDSLEVSGIPAGTNLCIGDVQVGTASAGAP